MLCRPCNRSFQQVEGVNRHSLPLQWRRGACTKIGLKFTKRKGSEVQWTPLGTKLGMLPVIGTLRHPSLIAHGVIADPRGPYETINDSEELYTLKPKRGQAVRCLYINRTNALNTLKFSTVEFMQKLLDKWIVNKIHSAITVKGAGDKAFCSGIDWREVYNALEKKDNKFVDNFMRNVYKLHYTAHCSSKPIISVINGLALGATGCGLALNAQFPLTTEKTVFALPETAMGFFPDCGMSYHLARAEVSHPGFGYFLGLTGHHLIGPDLAHLKLATHHILVHMVPHMEGAVGSMVTEDIVRVMSAIEQCHEPFGTENFSMEEHLPVIARCFTKDSIEGIIQALEKEIYSTWATDLAKKMRGMSPLSLKVTFRALREVIGPPRFNMEEFKAKRKTEEEENKRRIREFKEQRVKDRHRETQKELVGKLNGLLDNHEQREGASVSEKEKLQVVSKAAERLEGLPEASDVVERIISVESRQLMSQLSEELSKYLTFDDYLEQEAEKRNKELDNMANLLPSERKAIEEREANEDLEIKQLLNLKGYPYDIEGMPLEEFRKSIDKKFNKLSAVFDALDEDNSERGINSAEAIMNEIEPSSPHTPLTFPAVLERDFQIAMRFMQTEDFMQGIKARVITNTAPKWTHASVEEVPDAEVDELFRPLDEDQQLKWPEAGATLKMAIDLAVEMDRVNDSLLAQAEEQGLDDPEMDEFGNDMEQNFGEIVRHIEEEATKKKKKRSDRKGTPAPPVGQVVQDLEEGITNPDHRPSYSAEENEV